MTSAAPAGQWSTATVAEPAAFDYWRDLICATFVQLSASPVGHAPFAGDLRHVDFAGFEVSTVRAGAQRVRRTRELIAAAHEPFLLASVQTRGRGRVEQDGRVAVLDVGDMSFYDSTRPYTLHFDEPFEQVVVRVPRDDALATAGVRDPRAVTARTLGRAGAAGAVAGFFRSLAQAQRGDPAGAQELSDPAVGLLSSALALAGGGPGHVPDTALGREVVRRHLRRHLGDPGVTPDTIAAALHVSRRTLYRQFDGEPDGVMGVLRRMRVERARQLLTRHPGRTVRDVGEQCGFAGDAQFHRVFRAATGLTPGEFRSRAAQAAQAARKVGEAARDVSAR